MNKFDQYVGLPYLKGGRTRSGVDCWGLPRLVIGEITGFWLPSFDSSDPAGSYRRENLAYRTIAIDDLAELDVVVMAEDRLREGVWMTEPAHMGLYVGNGSVLHIRRDSQSRIEPLKDLRVIECKARPI